MKVISVNAGSSSLKFKLFQMPGETVLCEGIFERIGLEMGTSKFVVGDKKEKTELVLADHSIAVNKLLENLITKDVVKDLKEIVGVGHRVVHGGEKFFQSVVINDEVFKTIESCNDLAPLHNPANLIGIKSFTEKLPNALQVAVFDTAFHQTMEKEAYMYATPYEWYQKYGVRKYGFHGTSHRFVSERAASLLGKKPSEVNVIVAHLGNGASICAVKGGKSVETTMGLTPLAGLPMGTRSGDIDPAIVGFICEKENKDVAEVINMLNKKSGLLGVSGLSSDSRDIGNAILAGHERAKLANDLQIKAVADAIAKYAVYLGSVDAICFTAGIGENATKLRKNVGNRLSLLGIEIDLQRNDIRGKEKIISSDNSKITVMLIPTNEEVIIARDTFELI